MKLLTKTPSVVDLRSRADAADHAAAQALLAAGIARAEAASAMADGDAARASRARAAATDAQTEHEAQQDLAAELRRRAQATLDAEAREAFARLNATARDARQEAERTIGVALGVMAETLEQAQRAMGSSIAASAAAAAACDKLPGDERLSAASIPPYTPMLTDGIGLTGLGSLRSWRLMAAIS